MADLSNQHGYSAEESFKAGLSDEEPDHPGMTPAQMAAYLEAAPDDPDSYDDVSRWAARGVLRYLKAHPVALAAEYGDAFDLFERAFPRGPDGSLSSVHPQLAGISGYMVGWAVQAALYALGAPMMDNPTVITVEVEE